MCASLRAPSTARVVRDHERRGSPPTSGGPRSAVRSKWAVSVSRCGQIQMSVINVVQRAQYQLDGAVEVGGDLGDGPLPVVVELAQLGDVEGVAVFPRGSGSDRDAGGAEQRRAVFGSVPYRWPMAAVGSRSSR